MRPEGSPESPASKESLADSAGLRAALSPGERGEALGGADDGPTDGHRGLAAQPHGPEAGWHAGRPVSVCMRLCGVGGLFKRGSAGARPPVQPGPGEALLARLEDDPRQTSVCLSLT